MSAPQPEVGGWYRQSGGQMFEVVAFDADDGTVEIQYFDGTVEEMDIDDWEVQWDDGALETAEAPEDWTGSVDVEPEEQGNSVESFDDARTPRASSSLDGLDLFE